MNGNYRRPIPSGPTQSGNAIPSRLFDRSRYGRGGLSIAERIECADPTLTQQQIAEAMRWASAATRRKWARIRATNWTRLTDDELLEVCVESNRTRS